MLVSLLFSHFLFVSLSLFPCYDGRVFSCFHFYFSFRHDSSFISTSVSSRIHYTDDHYGRFLLSFFDLLFSPNPQPPYITRILPSN